MVTTHPGDPRHAALQQLLQQHIHLEPDALRTVAKPVAARFAHAFAPATLAAERCALFPPALLAWWAGLPTGHLLLAAATAGYVPGPLAGTRSLVNVAQIGLDDLTHDTFFHGVAHLLDHHLGCGGETGGPWLSDGAGFTPRWHDTGRRIAELFPLGYGASTAAQNDPHAYFAQALALYLRDRRGLNVQDPKLERLLHTTIMDDRFCRRALMSLP